MDNQKRKYIEELTTILSFQAVKAGPRFLCGKKFDFQSHNSFFSFQMSIIIKTGYRDENGQVRVTAARSVLEYGLKMTETTDVLSRLQELEAEIGAPLLSSVFSGNYRASCDKIGMCNPVLSQGPLLRFFTRGGRYPESTTDA